MYFFRSCRVIEFMLTGGRFDGRCGLYRRDGKFIFSSDGLFEMHVFINDLLFRPIYDKIMQISSAISTNAFQII